MTSTKTIASTNHLSKSFGQHEVLQDVNMHVPEGATYGLIGANGAGKTTLLRILLGLGRATSGSATVLGTARGKLPATPVPGIAFLPDVPEFNARMTPRAIMRTYGQLSSASGRHIDALLDLVGLAGVNTPVGGFSRGMRQRLGIAVSLVGAPRLLVLDEPTSALDPLGRADVLRIIAALHGKTTVMLSSHLLGDVQQVCTHVGLLDRGNLLLEGELSEVLSAQSSEESTLRISGPEHTIAAAGAQLAEQFPDLRINREQASLQDAFERLVGRDKK